MVNDSVDNNFSEFNSAAFKVKALAEFKYEVGTLWANPLLYNPDYGKYNYEVIFSRLVAVHEELLPWMDKTEEGYAEEFYKKIENILDINPPFQVKTSVREEEGTKTKFKKEQWLNLRHLLRWYQKLLWGAMKSHGFDSPTKDSDEGL